MPSSREVLHNVAELRFELRTEGQLAFLSYQHEGERVLLDHTWVPEALRGRGIAAALVRAALEEGRQRRWRIVPHCAYVAAFLRQHPEFSDLREGASASSETGGNRGA